MRKILVLGAGKSAPYLIRHLLEKSAERDWFVTVGDLDEELARSRVGEHPRGSAVRFDIHDSEMRQGLIREADVVVSMLAPAFHYLVGLECVHHGCHLVTASYRDRKLKSLEPDALRKGVLILCEMGMDPGIDHMSAMQLIQRLRHEGGKITGFASYGSGVPHPDTPSGPLRYAITWNPRNVVLAGQAGAQYLENGRIKVIPYHEVFHHTWDVQVEGFGDFEAYPNRDSLSYMRTFGLQDVETMIRGTLRYPGWSETWALIVRLGLTNETLTIPDLPERRIRDVVAMFLPLAADGATLEGRVARWLQISPTGRMIENLKWLGLFSDRKVGQPCSTVAGMMSNLLQEKLPLVEGGRDLVILQHEVTVEKDEARRKVTSYMIAEGERDGMTAMAKTVGLPAALGVDMILAGTIPLRGVQIPTHPSIFEPVLEGLAKWGLRFQEKEEMLTAPPAEA